MHDGEMPPGLAAWWSEDEFGPCPRCGGNTLAPPSPALDSTALRVCVACGIVPEPTES